MSFHTRAEPFAQEGLSFEEDVTRALRNSGVLIFASAGNDGVNVDEKAVGGAWETEWWAPCENDGVICVGGVNVASGKRAAKSNFGSSVRMWGPWSVVVGPDPDISANHTFGGTSAATPYVAGAAALVIAANPSLSADAVEHILAVRGFTMASYGTSWGDPEGAVWQAIGNVPPLVSIGSPAELAHVGYGGLNTVTFKAKVEDYEADATPADWLVCCSVKWTSDRDGVIGYGKTMEHVFASPGPRTVTATATDAAGQTRSDTMHLVVDNTPPKVTIQKPVAGATIYTNAPVTLLGTSFDANESSLALPCGKLSWSAARRGLGGTVLKYTGCQPTATFPTEGQWNVTLTGVDSHGASGKATVAITVIDPPPHSPPSVHITKPADNATLDPYVHTTLSGTAADPDGTGPITYKWTVIEGTNEKQIGTAASLQWKPSSDVSQNCGGKHVTLRLYATDPDGTTSDSVYVYVPYPLC
jgi:serine protease